ncbi:VQ motif-containing protein 20 [Cardamine amara subsp. amara]|uniref:VQ motif-containing protein 20 n=1 Tax=Cardamine amara subsp. amara TaxID=228776 RepID=A0ABD1BX24_CARAN
MSSTFNDHHYLHHPKREPNENNSGILYPPSPSPSPSPPTLKVNKDSHVIKKPPSSPSSSSSTGKPRHPVIIYTHTPKVIHTNPTDFMALVQKLTGMSRSEEDSAAANTTTDCGGKSINRSVSDLTVDRKINRNRCGGGGGGINNYQRSYSGTGAGAGNGKGFFFSNGMISEDSESSSVITTDENIGEHGHVNSSLPYSAVAITPPPQPSMYYAAGINYGGCLPTFPIFPPANPADNFLCGNQPFANIDDQLSFAPNMRSSFSSSSSSGFDGLTDFRDF